MELPSDNFTGKRCWRAPENSATRGLIPEFVVFIENYFLCNYERRFVTSA